MPSPSLPLSALFARTAVRLTVAPAQRSTLAHPSCGSAGGRPGLLVAGAGNIGTNPKTGYAGSTSPGNAPSAIAAGADDHIAPVSRLDDRSADDELTPNGEGGDVAGALSTARAIDFCASAARPAGLRTVPRCQSVHSAEPNAARTWSTNIGGQHRAPARDIVWGDNIVWGHTVYYNLPTCNPLRQETAHGIISGDNIVGSDRIIWGHYR